MKTTSYKGVSTTKEIPNSPYIEKQSEIEWLSLSVGIIAAILSIILISRMSRRQNRSSVL